MAALTAQLAEQSPVSYTVDAEQNRTYTVKWQVRCTDKDDGPLVASLAPGLPTAGASYTNIGGLNDIDADAYYNTSGTVNYKSKAIDGGGHLFEVTTPFTTKPIKRCTTDKIEDPLAEPVIWSGGTNKFTKQATEDRNGDIIKNGAWEPVKGPIVEVDDFRPSFSLSMNVSWIDLDFLGGYMNAVNDGVWWNKAARTIKVSDFNWERLLYGTCNFYFRVSFEFEYKADKWNIRAVNEANRLFIGNVGLGDSRNDPTKYKAVSDLYEELTTVFVDDDCNVVATPQIINAPDGIEYYPEQDFSVVGWPASAPI